MTEVIAVALITAAATIIAQLIISHSSTARFEQSQLDSQKFLEYKIDKLSERVDKHNNVVERVALIEKDIKVANHRIDDLERKVENI